MTSRWSIETALNQYGQRIYFLCNDKPGPYEVRRHSHYMNEADALDAKAVYERADTKYAIIDKATKLTKGAKKTLSYDEWFAHFCQVRDDLANDAGVTFA